MLIKKTYSIEDFEPWMGAIDTMDEAHNQGKLQELYNLIESCFFRADDDGELEINETELNDFLWHEKDYIYKTLGLRDEADDDEADDDEADDD